jgi:hypothetical protein
MPPDGICGREKNSRKHLIFFLPLHVTHLESRCPEIIKYLGLAPGWRFLVAPDYEDVWYDKALLHSP